MKFCREDLLLYAVTDRSWLAGRSLAGCVELCLQGGVTCVQMREKELDDDTFYNEALPVQALCRRYGVPFIINDNVDVALRLGADGVHVGQEDADAADVRRAIGRDMILGVSAQTAEQAKTAYEAGADYLGVGAVFSTATKTDADTVSLAELSAICRAVPVPVVAIGGISKASLGQLAGTGICGVALVSAIFAAEDIQKTCQTLHELAKKAVGTW